jgi:hypothetical protein
VRPTRGEKEASSFLIILYVRFISSRQACYLSVREGVEEETEETEEIEEIEAWTLSFEDLFLFPYFCHAFEL